MPEKIMPLDQALLDTNIVIDLFAGEPLIAERLAGKSALFLPVPALGELYRGAFKSSRVDENLRRINTFRERVAVLNCDAETARWYGETKNDLAAKGKPIPENDLWIAAIARQHSLLLITRDAHFKSVSNLHLDLLKRP
jgi:tRNA(fMet)-specific endonuclease VapC